MSGGCLTAERVNDLSDPVDVDVLSRIDRSIPLHAIQCKWLQSGIC